MGNSPFSRRAGWNSSADDIHPVPEGLISPDQDEGHNLDPVGPDDLLR